MYRRLNYHSKHENDVKSNSVICNSCLRYCDWVGDLHWLRDKKCDEHIKPRDKGTTPGVNKMNNKSRIT